MLRRPLLIRVLLAVSVTLVLLAGCAVGTQIHFVPSESAEKVALFDRYWIDIGGFKDKYYDYMLVGPTLINQYLDSSNIDSIPVLVIDSICFKSSCLGATHCLMNVDAKSLMLGASGRDAGATHENLTNGDVVFADGKCYIRGFKFIDDGRLRLDCNHQAVIVSFYARILDRRSGIVTASEIKEGHFVIKVKTDVGIEGTD